MAVNNYMTDAELKSYILGNDTNNLDLTISKIMSTKTQGIEGLPYQFLPSVDRRVMNTDVGRKYADKIFSRLPLLFLTPVEPLFMDDFSKNDRSKVVTSLFNTGVDPTDLAELLDKDNSGKYYTVDFNYSEYYDYLNTMLSCLAVYLGIYDKKISIGGKAEKKIGQIDWRYELNDDFKTFFSSQENVIFYLDSFDSVNETFSNSTTESSLAEMVNGFASTANEIKFLFGAHGNAAAELMNNASQASSAITSSLSGLAQNLAGGIVGSLANKGVSSVLNGGKIVFPQIWSDSDFSRSYSLEVKLRSPDCDNLSIFLNVLKPYCKLLALTLPRQIANSPDQYDPNAYGAPFLVKAYSKGMFNVDMGIISGLSVTKGANCQWNDDGLPTQIDIGIEITDLYSHMSMNKYDITHPASSIKAVVTNTSYMDFLANMAGLNIAQMELGRRITMAYYLTKSMGATAKGSVFSKIDQGVSKLIGKIYNTI